LTEAEGYVDVDLIILSALLTGRKGLEIEIKNVSIGHGCPTIHCFVNFMT
jgi:hypothetical protein